VATIKDVAKEAGVSVATVSRVINNSPKASKASITAVKSAMKLLGYRPNANARALVSKSTNTVGVLVGDVSDSFFGTLVNAVDNVAKQHGKHVLIGNGHHDRDQEKNAIELLINSRCESLIIHAKGLTDKELIEYSKEVKGMVLINHHIDEIASRCISLDNYKGAFMVTEHLIKLGHTQIACLASDHQIEDTEERVNGYKAALEKHNIPFKNSYIEYGMPNNIGGEAAMTNILSKSIPVTAVVCYNDFMAAGALSTLEENDIQTPSEMSVVGFDDALIARFLTPKLTTVKYPINLMAEKAAQLAISLAKGEEVEETEMRFSPTIVKRASAVKKTD
jgi:LacI family transcriptional regulator